MRSQPSSLLSSATHPSGSNAVLKLGPGPLPAKHSLDSWAEPERGRGGPKAGLLGIPASAQLPRNLGLGQTGCATGNHATPLSWRSPSAKDQVARSPL